MTVPDQEKESFGALFREATDSVVDLVAAHFKLANLELVADLQVRARELVLEVLLALVGVVGYALLMTGVALAARSIVGLPLAFILLGAFHVAAAGTAALVVAGRRKRAFRIEKALHSVGNSVTQVADAVLGPSGHAHV